MPGIVQQYEVLLNLKNDTHDPATVQLQKDYDRNAGSTVLLHPGESVTLVLDSGASYRYCLKTRAKVANVTAKAWRDVTLDMSRIFPSGSSTWPPLANLTGAALVNGVTIDKLWKDVRFCMWYDA